MLMLLTLDLSAATDGNVDATSTGYQDVTLTIGDQVRASAIDDIPLGSYSGSGGLAANDTMCVYRNDTGAYKVKLTSANELSGGFRLKSGSDYLAYTVDWTDATATTTSNVTSDVEITGQLGDATADDCNAVDNTQLDVTVAEAALQAAPTGTYADTITLFVSPE